MEKKMETTMTGCVGTTIRIHSFIPSKPKERFLLGNLAPANLHMTIYPYVNIYIYIHTYRLFHITKYPHAQTYTYINVYMSMYHLKGRTARTAQGMQWFKLPRPANGMLSDSARRMNRSSSLTARESRLVNMWLPTSSLRNAEGL